MCIDTHIDVYFDVHMIYAYWYTYWCIYILMYTDEYIHWCKYVYIHWCIWMYTYTDVYIYTYIDVYGCIYILMYIFIHILMYMDTCTETQWRTTSAKCSSRSAQAHAHITKRNIHWNICGYLLWKNADVQPARNALVDSRKLVQHMYWCYVMNTFATTSVVSAIYVLMLFDEYICNNICSERNICIDVIWWIHLCIHWNRYGHIRRNTHWHPFLQTQT